MIFMSSSMIMKISIIKEVHINITQTQNYIINSVIIQRIYGLRPFMAGIIFV